MLVMLLDEILLSSCFPVLLHMDMVVGLEGMDGLIGEFDPLDRLAATFKRYAYFRRT